MLCVFIIFVSHWLIISCNEMLPVLRLNESKRVVGGKETEGFLALKLSDMNRYDQTSVDADAVKQVLLASQPTPAPMKGLEAILLDFLYGRKTDGEEDSDDYPITESSATNYSQFPTGRLLHSELFLNKSAVHLPSPDLLHSGHCRLRLTDDYMQTAVDAFAIIHEGSLDDVRALPGDYVLRSARTIAIMRLPQEKLSAMWDIVLNGRKPNTITYETLEVYRPLFKYLSGKQMARLNLTDKRIVNYIGTHPELTRHQVGVVASRYIKVNRKWRSITSLNNMNNLLCGVPMTFMRKLDGAEYLRLEHQPPNYFVILCSHVGSDPVYQAKAPVFELRSGHLAAVHWWGSKNAYHLKKINPIVLGSIMVFYHIRACDPLQKRFYLNMMTRTQALGKSFSWSARDVSRLGLLLAEVEGPALATISPEAMVGVSFHVMCEMKPENLKYLTDLQIKYIKRKARNIMSRKLKEYDASMVDAACRVATNIFLSLLFATTVL